MQEEKTDKDHLIKELTSKNLELLARIATIESTIKPLNDDLKAQVVELRNQFDKVTVENKYLN